MKRWISLYIFTGVMVCMATLVNAQSAPAPNVLEPFETLKGQSPLSVFIAIDGDRFLFGRAEYDPQLSASGFRAQIETQLKKNGITVLPAGPAKYPALQIRINSEVATGFNVAPSLIYTIDLEYLQLLPIRSPGVGSPQLAEARTWRSGGYGIIPTDYVATVLPKEVGRLIEQFITAYTKANLASITKQSAGQPGGVPLSKSEIGGLVWRGFVLGDASGYVTFGNLYDVPASQRAVVEKQINDLRDKKQQVISCTYGGGYFYSFWYKSPPANLRELLDSVPEGKHPLRGLFFASAETCPASKELADKLLRAGRIR